MTEALPGLATAYWDYVRLTRSDERVERLQAEFSAEILLDVDRIVSSADKQSLALIDALLRAPGAEPALVGAGPLEALLAQDGPVVQDAVAQFARQDPLWREALSFCYLDTDEATQLPDLAKFLPETPSKPRRT